MITRQSPLFSHQPPTKMSYTGFEVGDMVRLITVCEKVLAYLAGFGFTKDSRCVIMKIQDINGQKGQLIIIKEGDNEIRIGKHNLVKVSDV